MATLWSPSGPGRRLTPVASVRNRGLDLHRDGGERPDGDGEDETHRQRHQPDLRDEQTL